MSNNHDWNTKPTGLWEPMLDKPSFCADALRKMVANCVALHAAGNSLYTDGERKLLLAAAEHIENLFSHENKARKALEFYRDGFQFHPKRSKTGIDLSEWKPKDALLEDCGEVARSALLSQNKTSPDNGGQNG